MFLEILQNSQKNICASLFFNKVTGLRLYKIPKNTFFTEHLCATASEILRIICLFKPLKQKKKKQKKYGLQPGLRVNTYCQALTKTLKLLSPIDNQYIPTTLVYIQLLTDM